MSWRDDAHTLPPPTPEQKPDLTQFLDIVSGKCFDAQKLIEEDLLCHFRFTGKNVQLVGDLGDRMTKAEMMKALKERKANPEKALALAPRARRREKPLQREGRGGSVSLDFFCRLVPDQDFDLVKSVPDLVILEAASLHFMQALMWTGEATNHLSQARNEVVRTKRSMDGVLGHHDDLLKQLEEMRAQEDRKKESLQFELEAARADAKSSKALAQSLEAKVQRSEEENKALQTEVKKLQEEAPNSWQLGKEEFLQANGYSEEEHPASFLDVEQALADMPEESEENSSGSEEAPPS
ncbi:spindle pole body component 110-like [Dorcoceras hygrometricum]|uniref:Spindle pole body component 110-like n=1 Tax=Dorcoceras hygrometricum TaxID=472368 RepID=A0A2Z7C0P2_9LAMI|nr:spindle pole body component 110-like [Dorcoceras hygrometricum]